jgi:hypothetical protein
MKPLVIDQHKARRIILHAAALAQPAPFGSGPEAVYQMIARNENLSDWGNSATHYRHLMKLLDYEP